MSWPRKPATMLLVKSGQPIKKEKFCTECGTKIEGTPKFCPECEAKQG